MERYTRVKIIQGLKFGEIQCSIEGVKIINLRRNNFCYFTLCKLDTSIVHVHVYTCSILHVHVQCTWTTIGVPAETLSKGVGEGVGMIFAVKALVERGAPETVGGSSALRARGEGRAGSEALLVGRH